MNRLLTFAPIALVLATLAPQAPGADQAATAPMIDPPQRVARLSYILGEVSFQAGDGQAPEAAVINRPVTIGDRLLTGSGARSELTLGVAAIRLDELTDLTIANLDADIAHVEVNSGTVSVHVRELQSGEIFQVDTPSATVALLEPGDYRVEIDADGTVFLEVRAGMADLDTGAGAVQVSDGDQARLPPGERLATLRDLGRPDSFDEWSADRERQLNGEQTIRHVSREVVGYEELDRHGSWRVEGDYGAVWYPRVSTGWAPYRYGHWTWISPWGWTWIDDASWGFAPFHYGRWTYLRSQWCWIPGPRRYRPVYAPALVGWVGNPYSGISVTVGTGPIGWFALGPREIYVPHRHVSPRYLRNVNISNTTVVNNTYITNVARNRVRNIRHTNRSAPDAVTTAPRRNFDARQPGERRHESRIDRRDNSRNGMRSPERRTAPGATTTTTTARIARPSRARSQVRPESRQTRKPQVAQQRPQRSSPSQSPRPALSSSRYRDTDNQQGRREYRRGSIAPTPRINPRVAAPSRPQTAPRPPQARQPRETTRRESRQAPRQRSAERSPARNRAVPAAPRGKSNGSSKNTRGSAKGQREKNTDSDRGRKRRGRDR